MLTRALILALLPLPAAAEFLRAPDGTQLYYQTAGEGPVAVLFVPGWMGSADAYIKQFAHFEGSKDYTFVSFDPRGQGRSDLPLYGWDMATRAADIEAVLQAVGKERVVVGGWSWGSLDAMAWLQAHAGDARLRGALILDGPVKPLGSEAPGAWSRYETGDANGWRQWYTMGPVGGYEGFIAEAAGGGFDAPTPEDLAFFKDMMHQTSPLVAAATNEIGTYVDYTATAEATAKAVPMLVYANAGWADQARAWTEAHLPGAVFASFGKHAMHYEYAGTFDAILDDWLKTLTP